MVNISKLGDSSIKFTFTDNDRYLYNGEITVPLNSLILVLDESDMAVFKKIDGDLFVSFLISNSNFSSKSDLETFYKANMVGSTGGGGGITSGEVQTMIDESISGKADISAATVTNTESGSTSGTGIQNTYTFNYSDGVYYFSAATSYREDMLSFSQIKYKSSADGVEKTISSTGDTDDYTYTKINNTGTITFKGNNYLTNINVFGDGTGYGYIYYYNSSAPVAVSTVIEDVIYPKLESLDAALSGKIDNASAVTDTRILTVSQQNELQLQQRKNNEYTLVGTVYKIGSGLTWDYTTKKIDVDSNTVALKSDVTTDSAITSSSTNAVQSSAIYDKVTITVEESGSTGGTYQNNLFTFDYSDGVTYFSAGSVNSSDLLFASGVKYKSSASGEEITIGTNGETDDYIYNYAGKTITVTLKGNNRLVSVNASTIGTDGFNYSYNYTNSTTQWLKDYVSALEARVALLEQQNNT